MKKTLPALLVAVWAVSLLPCSSADAYKPHPKLVTANNEFGFTLLRELSKSGKTENVFISPSSISLALEMVYNGARGSTKQAMDKTLQFNGLSVSQINSGASGMTSDLAKADPKVEIDIANSLWTNHKLKPEFAQDCKHYYNAGVGPLNIDTINAWVKRATHEKIANIVEKSDARADLILVNAVYFNGTWTYPFNAKATTPGKFFTPGASGKTVRMMSQNSEFGSLRGAGFSAIRLPYGQRRLAMYIFLPDQNSSLSGFVKNLDAKRWDIWMSRFEEKPVSVRMPKFRCEYKSELRKPLSDLGMGIAFGERADFDLFRPSFKTGIDKVIHKTFIKVDEKGTEATAATAVTMLKSSPLMVKPIEFVVDRPFFCAIRDDKTGAILFAGLIYDPQDIK